jgi:hypothetical protein
MMRRVSILAVLFIIYIVTGIISVTYVESAKDRLLEKIENRAPLSEHDATAKAKTLALLPKGERSGTLYSSKKIYITYTYGKTDNFQVEILTGDIQQAKEEGVKWFLDRGFSKEFICDYPVEFYLNIDLKSKLSNTKTIFNPLPPNCR